MSNIADAKKTMDEIKKKIGDQQQYAKLKEEERLKLFQDYFLSLAQANEAYHAKEAKYEKTLKENIKELEPELRKMAKFQYGPDVLPLLDDGYPRRHIFRGTILPKGLTEEEKKDHDSGREKRDWESRIETNSSCHEYYLEARKQFDSLWDQGDIKGVADLIEEVCIMDAETGYERTLKGKQKDEELTPKEKKVDDMRTAFQNSVLSHVKAEMQTVIENGEEKKMPVVTPEGEKLVKDFIKEITDRHVKDVIDVQRKTDALAKKLEKENIPELELLKDDKKFLKRLANTIVSYQDPSGINRGARWQAQYFFNQILQGVRVDGVKSKMDGDWVHAYGTGYIDRAVKIALKENGIFDYFAIEDEVDRTFANDKIDGMKHKDTDLIEGFRVKHGPVKEGESYFYQVPEKIKKISMMSNSKLLLAELGLQEQQKRAEEEKALLADEMKKEANQLIQEMNNLNPKPRETPLYKELQDSLINITRYGTPEFKALRIKEGDAIKYNKTDKKSAVQLSQGARIICNVAKDYFKDLMAQEKEGKKYDWTGHRFAEKLENFGWEKDLKAKQLTKEVDSADWDVLKKAKEARKLQDNEFLTKVKVNVAEDQFSKEVKKYMDAYSKASTLHKCSSEYKKVGREMSAFREKYNAMLQIEKDMNDPKKPYEPGANKKLLKAVQAVKESIAKVQKANDEYIIHKKKDKQFGPDAAQYSKDRIAAVEGMNYSVKWLDKVMDQKMEYVLDNATRYGYLDAYVKKAARVMEREKDPALNQLAKCAFNSLGRFCKMPDQESEKPMTPDELDKYRYDLAVVVLAEYAATPTGKKFMDECRKANGAGINGFKKTAQQMADSKAFKDAIPKDISRKELLDTVLERSKIHDIRVEYVKNKNIEMKKGNNNLNPLKEGENKIKEPIKGPVK